MISAANITSFVRSLVGEATAKWWTDAEITLYTQFSMARIQGELYPWLWDKKKTFADFAITSGTAAYDEPSDCFKVSHIQVKSNGKKLQGPLGEDEYYKFADWEDGEPVAWMYKGGQILLVPTPATTDTDYLMIWYMTALDAVTDFPDSVRGLIGVEAAILARAKNKELTQDLFELRKMYKEAAIMELTMTTGNQVQEIHDFSEEASFA